MMTVFRWIIPWFTLGLAIALLGDFLHGHFSIVRGVVFAMCVGALRDSAGGWIKRLIKEAGQERVTNG